MSILGSATGTTSLLHDERHGPLVPLLLILTMVTGLVDAISYLQLGHVFVANMTGNVAFLGFAVADAQDFSIWASISATAAFLVGGVAGGRLGLHAGHHRGRLLAIASFAEIVLIGAALIVSMAILDPNGELVRYALIVLLALAMGLQNAVARRLAVPDLTTTVLALTLTGIAADSTLAGGSNLRLGRQVVATVTMLVGAAVGAFLVLSAGGSAVLALVFVLLALTGSVAYRVSASSAAWIAEA
jgi:uncharacterized membrane protein YoaK (UPF0700 family)